MFARLRMLAFDRTRFARSTIRSSQTSSQNPSPHLFASPLLSLPIIWIRESKLNLFYKRRIIDPLKVFIIIIYSLFQKQLKIIINRISSERVRTFANSASIDHLCSNRARTCVCVCVCVTKSHGKNVAYLAGHVSFYPCTRFNSWDLKILRVPTFHLKVTSSSAYRKASPPLPPAPLCESL